jgi:hypothetical protein
MASLERVFNTYASDGTIRTPQAWSSFTRAVANAGHSSPLFNSILKRLSASVAAHRGVSFASLVSASADLLPQPTIDRALIDLEMDGVAVRRFLWFMQPRLAPGSASALRLNSAAEDVAITYRATLLHLLRLAVREAAAIDASQREAILTLPVEEALQAEAGAEARLSTLSLIPSPFDFQRVHARAIAVRLSAVHVRARALARRARLYRLDRAHGTSRILHTTPALRAASIDIFVADRAGVDNDAGVSVTVPNEIEVISLPPLAAVDAIGTSPLTLHSWYAVAAAAEGVTHDAATAAAAGGLPVPAPSALPGIPRAVIQSVQGIYNDYGAHSELILSPYFADACGLHEGSEEDSGPGAVHVIGLPTLFCYE